MGEDLGEGDGELVAERVGRPAELAGHRGVDVAVRHVVRVDDGVAAVGIYSQRYLRWAVEVVGVQRILFATDYRIGPAPTAASSSSFRPRGAIGPTRSGSPQASGMRSWPASGADHHPARDPSRRQEAGGSTAMNGRAPMVGRVTAVLLRGGDEHVARDGLKPARRGQRQHEPRIAGGPRCRHGGSRKCPRSPQNGSSGSSTLPSGQSAVLVSGFHIAHRRSRSSLKAAARRLALGSAGSRTWRIGRRLPARRRAWPARHRAHWRVMADRYKQEI